MKLSKTLSGKLLLGCALSAALTVGAICSAPSYSAPSGHKSGERRGHHGDRLERMAKDLNLTSIQKAKIKAIMDNSRARSTKIRNDTKLNEAQKRDKMHANFKETFQKINVVLTPAQRKKLEEKRKARRANRGPHKGR